MPNFFSFDGIKIYVYFNDHVPPHVHAIYGEHEALIIISNAALYEGWLPKKQFNKAAAFVLAKQDALFALFDSLNPNLKP